MGKPDFEGEQNARYAVSKAQAKKRTVATDGDCA